MKKRIHKKRSKNTYKKHYGARVKPSKRYNYFWALDVPDSFPNEPKRNIFQNKCFITATILALLQNIYFKSERKDTRFLNLQNINSINRKKQNNAGSLLLKEVEKMISKTLIPNEGPYELETTAKRLNEVYNCQFFIFDGIDNSNKLKYMYPNIYDDNLIPIYLYEPNDNPNHVVFIRNINSYFKGNVQICFACKKTFLTYNYKHFCKEKKSCFSCRRFFMTESTYIHEKLLNSFCDKNITKERSFTCSLCNVTCYSNHCFVGHKKICTGQGTFGYKCLKCNKFTYRHGNLNGTNLKNRHICGETKHCTSCRKEKEENHLCSLLKEVCKDSDNTNIAFFTLEHFDSSNENCIDCFNLRQLNGTSLFCDIHVNTSQDLSEPCLAVIYQYVKSSFTKYVISHFQDEPKVIKEENALPISCPLLNNNISSPMKKTRKSLDFQTNMKRLQEKHSIFLIDKFLQLITKDDWFNTTFICQDFDSRTMMSLLQAFVKNGFCPVVVRNGRKILLLELKSLKLRFLTSNSYFEGSENEIAELYNIQFTQHFFPKQFLLPQNWNYEGPIPEYCFFNSITDTSKTQKNKKIFVDVLQKSNYKWNLQKELVIFSEQRLLLLLFHASSF